MAINFDKFVIDRIDTVTLFDKATGDCKFIFDEIKDGSLENGSEKVYGTGAAGARISVADRNKTSKFSCTNGYVVGAGIAAQTGKDITTETSMRMPYMEYFTIGAATTSVTTTYKAIGTAGAEIKLYKCGYDKSLSTAIVQAATASETAFAYTPATKSLTVPTAGLSEGDIIVAFYDFNATGKKISNLANTFPKAGKLVLDAVIKDPCDAGASYHAKIVFPNASVDGNFTLTFGNEPSVHNFACEALPNVCAVDKTYWDIFIPDGEAA